MKKNQNNAKIFNADDNSKVLGAEIKKNGDVDFGTFITNKNTSVNDLEQFATNAGIKLDIVSVAPAAEGGNVVIVKSKDCLSKLVDEINKNGSSLNEQIEEKHFDPWKWRAYTSIAGQGLQIASSFLAKNSSPDTAAIMGFGALNLAANFCNWTFGAQHNPDEHQLTYLKSQYRQAFAQIVENPDLLPKVDGNQLVSRVAEIPNKSFGDQVYETAQHYSTIGGEIGLRLAGATSLAFPFPNMPKALSLLMQGQPYEAFQAAKNPNDVTFQAGIATLAGKFISLAAKAKDPYSPEERNVVDVFREDIAFKASSVIEGAAAGYMMLNRLNFIENKENGMPSLNEDGTPKKNELKFAKNDYLGAAGNAIFIGGYGIRFTAPYGSLDVDMPHIYAFISDCLAQVPHEKIPETLMASAANLKQHFADNHDLSFTDIYAAISEDLYNHHGIDVAMWAKINERMQNNQYPTANNIQNIELQGLTAKQSEQSLAIN
jgi:hypothetical protein